MKRIFRDSTKAWIESNGPIHWLADGSFLWLSERDGWKHLYHYSGDGTLLAQLTSGNWEIRGSSMSMPRPAGCISRRPATIPWRRICTG